MSPVHETGRHGGDRDRPGTPEQIDTSSLPHAGGQVRSSSNLTANRLARETLADSEAALLEHALTVAAFGDAEAYRVIACEALAMLHTSGVREAALRRQNAALRDELRRYTAAQVKDRAA